MSSNLSADVSTPGDADNLTYLTPPLATPHPTALHSGIGTDRYYLMYAMSSAFPLAAGALFLGWRAMGVIITVLLTVLAGTIVWRRIGRRGAQLHYPHLLWLGCLLAMVLPAHLFSAALWPILPAAGLMLVMLAWLLGGAGSLRLHPVILTFLLVAGVFRPVFVPHGVLASSHLLLGDVRRTTAPAPEEMIKTPWAQSIALDRPALWREPAFAHLTPFTSGRQIPEHTSLTLESLLRDRMPPLEDLILGGHPALIGSASAIAAIIGGLFLIYHGLIDYRIPLLIYLAAMSALLVLPVPVVITVAAREWRWIPLRDPAVGWSTAVTFANYELFASPLAVAAFFFATSTAIRPMTRRGRTIYALLAGALVAPLQLYFDALTGPMIAVLVTSLITPLMDAMFRPRPLV